jgi:hypothetical protein
MDKGKNNIVSEFYLVNTNTAWLKRNFEFIQAFFAGAEWLHMKHCIIQPPNVYHVLCPGRFQIYWAAIDIEVTFEGKLKRNIDASLYFQKLGIKSIDLDMLWPEAWKVKVEIKDLTPNNFNLYAEYYQHGFNADEIKSLEEYIGVTKAISGLTEYIIEMAKDIKDTTKENANNIKSNLTTLANTMKNSFGSFMIDDKGEILKNSKTDNEKLAENLANTKREWSKVSEKTDDPTHDQKKEAYKNAIREKIKFDRSTQGLSVSDAELDEAVKEGMGAETTSQETIRKRQMKMKIIDAIAKTHHPHV